MFSLDMSGLDAFRARLAYARAQLPDLMQQAVHDAGQFVAQNLQDAAPVGTSEGAPPPGDASGRLAESFYVNDEGPSSITVRTKQPQKLEWVVKGRGEVRPVVKKALYWKGADHPVRRVGPTKPNDFVSPVIEEAPTAEDVLGVVVDELIGILEG